MRRKFRIRQKTAGAGAVRIVVIGEVDLCAHDELYRAILAAVERHVAELVIDLSGVTLFDSGAVGVLVAGRNVARRYGCAYRIDDPPELVRRVLRANGILPLLVGEAVSANTAGHPA